ncbi:MAG: hypothetical protein RL090_104 [Bacteroidota bacterium]|jgi:hypothetical protein
MKTRTTYSSINKETGTATGSHFAYDHSEEETNFKTAVVNIGTATIEFISMLLMTAVMLASYIY